MPSRSPSTAVRRVCGRAGCSTPPWLARANRAAYEEPDVADLAATCAFELVRNHPLVDGNKRTGFVAGATILLLNGFEMTASEGKVVATFRQLAEGSLTEQQLANWFRANSTRS